MRFSNNPQHAFSFRFWAETENRSLTILLSFGWFWVLTLLGLVLGLALYAVDRAIPL